MSLGNDDVFIDWWVKELHLDQIDKDSLLDGSELSDAAQLLMKCQFGHITGFQSCLLSNLNLTVEK